MLNFKICRHTVIPSGNVGRAHVYMSVTVAPHPSNELQIHGLERQLAMVALSKWHINQFFSAPAGSGWSGPSP